jgi:hypothetical protein
MKSRLRHLLSRRWAPVGLCGVILAVALIPMIPNIPFSMGPTSTPSYFTSSGVTSIPAGAPALVYPYPTSVSIAPLLWQAESGMRYDSFGGYARTGPALDPASSSLPLLQPSQMQALFFSSYIYTPKNQVLYGALPRTYLTVPPFSRATFQAMRTFCTKFGVHTIVVDPLLGQRPDIVVRYLTAAFGSPVRSGGMEEWKVAAQP